MARESVRSVWVAFVESLKLERAMLGTLVAANDLKNFVTPTKCSADVLKVAQGC